MIDAATKPDGEEFEAYNIRRWGGSGWTGHMKSEGRKDGATFKKWVTWPNTFKAHQLIRLAENKGVDTNLSNKALFEAVYEEGQNISLVDTLVEIATGKLGLSAEEVRDCLEFDRLGDEIKSDINAGRRKYDISGVPFFIIGAEGRKGLPYAMSGAQSPNTFLKTFETVLEEE
jgi:predicted DsbA family dithiol-disulfide isomerase